MPTAGVEEVAGYLNARPSTSRPDRLPLARQGTSQNNYNYSARSSSGLALGPAYHRPRPCACQTSSRPVEFLQVRLG